MAGFIMTLDSDDEGPPRSPSPSTPPSSTRKAPSTNDAAPVAKGKKGKAAKGAKAKGKGKKLLDTVVDADDDEDAPVDSLRGGAADEELRMDKGFVFDGLGGGFIGRERNNVWVCTASGTRRATVALMLNPSRAGLGRGVHSEAPERHGMSP